MSSKKYVTTISGKSLPIEKTKKFNKSYYEIGDVNIENSGDCYLMGDDKYYRVETGMLVFDHKYKRYMIKSLCKNLREGFIDSNGTIGLFSLDIGEEVTCVDKFGKEHYALSREIFKSNYTYREKLSDGKFVHISRLKARDFKKISIPSSHIKQSLPYDSHNIMGPFIKKYQENELLIDEDSKVLGSLIKDYTFGLEFETTSGFIPRDLCLKNSLIPLRDGSITGLEFVTIPLQGEKGVQTVKNVVNLLKERTYFDDKCALHLHIGNIPRTKEFILAFVIATLHLQNEIFELFPLYKKYNFGYKNKNYAAPYPSEFLLSKLDSTINSENIDKNFDVIFRFLSEGASFDNYNFNLDNVLTHPNNPQNNQKWNVHTRYFIHNVIPLIFGNKETVEFRIHTPTYDINKILAFMLMNVSIVNYIKKFQDNILKNVGCFIPPILEIMEESFSSYEYRYSLMTYFKNRKEIIKQSNRNSKIFVDESEISCFFDRTKSSLSSFSQNIVNEYSGLTGGGFGISIPTENFKYQVVDLAEELRKHAETPVANYRSRYTEKSSPTLQKLEQLKKQQRRGKITKDTSSEPIPVNSYFGGVASYVAQDVSNNNSSKKIKQVNPMEYFHDELGKMAIEAIEDEEKIEELPF